MYGNIKPLTVEKKVDEKEEKIVALDDSDIQILKTYGQGPYAHTLKKVESDIKDIQKRINEKLGQSIHLDSPTICNISTGVKESDTGLAAPNLWDLAADRQRMSEEHPLQVARCTKIIPVDPKLAEAAKAVNPLGAMQGQKGADEQDKYVINIRQIAKFVVGLGDRVAPTDIEEGMRVGVDRTKYQIQIPLPPKIDASVTMMQVEEKPDVTYSDVGGCKEQIEKLREVVETPLLSPERFVNLGIDPPKGVLLFGPPGTGKTLCARAVANRTDATFIRVIGSELVQKYVGEGARMVRELFEMARSKKACIIFFDEVDAIGGARFDDGAGGDNEVQRTMLELINQLDGFDPRGNIKVLMATNRQVFHSASFYSVLTQFSLPDNEGRANILKIHARSMSVERDIRFDLIARLCPNTTGAELRSVATEAGMFAIRARRKVASERDFLDAVEKVVRQGTKFSSTQAPPASSAEISQLLDRYDAASPPSPLNLSQLISFGRPLTSESVLQSSQFVLSNIPRGLAFRIHSLETLPFIVGTNPFIANTLNAHRESFQFLANYPIPRTIEDNAGLAEELKMLVESHANDIPTMAKGFQECSRYLSPTQVSHFLDGAIRNRISVRLMAEQHIALSDALKSQNHTSQVGVIDGKCSPADMIRSCGSFVKELCEATLGSSPTISINGVVDATFPYVPVHLEYILTEILKNSFRATVEHYSRQSQSSKALPPVVITLSPPPAAPAPGPKYFSLRIRDQGGGISPTNMLRIFSYAFTTAGRNADEDDSGGGPYAAQYIGGSAAIGDSNGEGSLFGEITKKGLQTGMGTIAGLGYGLPMSKLYAKYFGGSDVFLKLRCLDESI
ncbi:26S proteasome subunit P45 [Armillaria solidipes]|uniref:26S proteasome regulatory subunit 7 homolog n=1 Tax=Armillaria solidipes TaxID=1076256 RepID=A0A2H3C3U9_9AGAR|nr:26S proteasome subunit P45 [Armillaria solidipes]